MTHPTGDAAAQDEPRLHGDAPDHVGADRFRKIVASLDLAYTLVEMVYDAHGRPVDYRVLEHNDAMERQLGTSGAGRTAHELTPGIQPFWAAAFGRVAETGETIRFEHWEPAIDRWLDAFAVRVGDPRDHLVAVVFRDVSARHRNEDALRAGRERHEFLLRLVDALRPIDDPAEVQQTAARLIAEQLDADRAVFIEAGGDDGTARMSVAHAQPGPAAPRSAGRTSSLPAAAFGEALTAEMAAGRTIVVRDLATDPRMPPGGAGRPGVLRTGAAIAVPLVKGGRWVATLAVHARWARTWRPDEVALVEEAADRTWVSVERAAAAEALAAARLRLDEERERTLAQERAARRQAEAATQMRDEFLASVSHELRTPLAAILLWSRLLASGRIPGRELEALGIIERNAEAQRLLVDDLLDASRAMAGTLSISPLRQAVAPVVEEAVRAMRPLADNKGVDLELVAGDVTAPVDAARVAQVVRNLLDNAIRHTPPGGHVRVVVGRDGQHAEIAVTDTGSGIDPAFLPHVFERFRRGAPGAGTSGALGLGLSISKELVGLHGGTITAASTGPGTGAAFTVRIPLDARAAGVAGSSPRTRKRRPA